jgi:hypothetical protein
MAQEKERTKTIQNVIIKRVVANNSNNNEQAHIDVELNFI